nr:MAG TPA: hypothetical protein [Caudoviricetes sp.]
MSPFDVECETFHDVIRIYSRLRTMQIKEAAREGAPLTGAARGGVIRRPAGDNWF